MAISFIAKKQRIIAEAKKKEAKPALKKLAEAIKNMNRLSGDEKEKLKELVNAVYEKFVEKPTPNKKGETEKPTKKPSRSISQILKEFKAKIGAEKWREATRGTDIYRDMERPALKKGKRIVRKKGKTSNQYGTFKNKVGGTYYESRTNRSDVNQPSDKRYPKLMHGGMLGDEKVLRSANDFKIVTDLFEDLREKRFADNFYIDSKANAVVFLASANGTQLNRNDRKKEEIRKYFKEGSNSESLRKKMGQIFDYEKNQPIEFKDVNADKFFTHRTKNPPIAVSPNKYVMYKVYFQDRILYNDGGEFGGGGRTGKKRLKRKKVTRQNANYDKKADSGLIGKPQGHRFTNKLAKRLGKTSYAKPTQEQIEKYRGKGIYSENRQDKSDVNPKKTYPSLGNGGMMFAKGGLLEKIKNSDTISEKEINQLIRKKIRNRRDLSFREVFDYYHKVGFPRLDAEQTKKEYDFLMNLWKSPTGKVATNNPFSESEQKVLEDFSHFKFDGFKVHKPVYKVVAKNGSSFEYWHSGGSIKIDRYTVGEYGGGGRTGKKRLKRKKVTRQNPNYDKKADSGLIGKPQGHRFTNKLAKRLGKTSYAKPTQEQIEKYRGKGIYSENRQDKSDVNPKKTYPSL